LTTLVVSRIEGMTTEIVNNIDRRLQELQGEIAKLETARVALINGATPAAPSKPRRARPTPAKPRPQVVPAGKLTTLLARSDGMTTRQLADTTNGEQSQILSLLRELEQADQVRRSGQRRGTRWHVITDEDRIAERVAELERAKR
jgi:hypothetical protein